MDWCKTLLGLQEGWDGYSGRRIRPDVIEEGKRVLELAGAGGWVVVPCSDGSIQIEWHEEDGEIEVYVDGPGEVSFWARHGGEEAELDLAGNEEEFVRWIKRVTGGKG